MDQGATRGIRKGGAFSNTPLYSGHYGIERGSWSALLARCCLLAGYCPVERREEDAVKELNKEKEQMNMYY